MGPAGKHILGIHTHAFRVADLGFPREDAKPKGGTKLLFDQISQRTA